MKGSTARVPVVAPPEAGRTAASAQRSPMAEAERALIARIVAEGVLWDTSLPSTSLPSAPVEDPLEHASRCDRPARARLPHPRRRRLPRVLRLLLQPGQACARGRHEARPRLAARYRHSD